MGSPIQAKALEKLLIFQIKHIQTPMENVLGEKTNRHRSSLLYWAEFIPRPCGFAAQKHSVPISDKLVFLLTCI